MSVFFSPTSFSVMNIEITQECKHLIKFAAKKLKGHERRAFISTRLTETEFGVGRHTAELGMYEKRTGLICYGNYASSGKQKTEDTSPQLIQDICSLVEPESQADRQLPAMQHFRLHANHRKECSAEVNGRKRVGRRFTSSNPDFQ